MQSRALRHRLQAAGAAALITAFVGSLPAGADTVKLQIDRDHTTVGFSVRHLFTRVRGRFKQFEGTIDFDEKKPGASTLKVTIQTASVDTDVEARDKDLRSGRFFDAETYPTITFTTTEVTGASASSFKIRGFLTMHGVRKEVVLDAGFLGKGQDPWGNERYGFHASTTISRKEFGMQWNEVLETGGVLVGDEVEISLDVEAIHADA